MWLWQVEECASGWLPMEQLGRGAHQHAPQPPQALPSYQVRPHALLHHFSLPLVMTSCIGVLGGSCTVWTMLYCVDGYMSHPPVHAVQPRACGCLSSIEQLRGCQCEQRRTNPYSLQIELLTGLAAMLLACGASPAVTHVCTGNCSVTSTQCDHHTSQLSLQHNQCLGNTV